MRRTSKKSMEMVMSKRKKGVPMNKKTQDFIVESLESGITPHQLAKKYPDKTPDPATIYRFCDKDEEFNNRMNTAYTSWMMGLIAENDYISQTPSTELYPKLEFKEAEATRKARMDFLKFTLGKMAPILSKRFDKAAKVEVDHNNAPQIAIIDYSVQQPVEIVGETLDNQPKLD